MPLCKPFVSKRTMIKGSMSDFGRSLELNLHTNMLGSTFDTMSLDEGKDFIMNIASEVIADNPGLYFKVQSNVKNINSKLELQKYVYNTILLANGLGSLNKNKVYRKF